MGLLDGRVLVAGAGIAGLAVARALHQRDIPVLVLECLAGLPDAGVAINLPGNAIHALTALGLAGGGTLAGQRDSFEREDLDRFPCSTKSPVAVTGTR
jgi:2-polyprenyl-6-methoxyphenol hydroxylase-like FAD-dependent oxidoreductase